MELSGSTPNVRAGLEWARRLEAERIARAVKEHRIVGLLGEGEVGKSETVGQALAGVAGESTSVICLDLDAAASDAHVGFLLAREVARVVAGDPAFSILRAAALLPARIEGVRLELVELLGVVGFNEALRDWPSGEFPAAAGIEAVEALAGKRQVVLWVDHLESPSLTPRHPLNVDRLLWGIRETAQREAEVRVVLSGRKAFERKLLGPKAAFHQQGKWLSLDNPSPEAWQEVATRLGISAAVVGHLAEMTGGHPVSMQLAILAIADRPVLPHAYDVLRGLAARDDGLAGRAMQHARSLHRLGGQLMTQIARGERPYAASQRGGSSTQEVRKVLERLRLAGLVRRRERWEIVNPLLAIRLRGSVRPVGAPLPPYKLD